MSCVSNAVLSIVKSGEIAASTDHVVTRRTHQCLEPSQFRVDAEFQTLQHAIQKAFLALICTALATPGFGQIPTRDSRNGPFPNGGTHFKMPVYATRAEWETHAEHLRQQILSAAGLLPLPERVPLNPQITSRIEQNGYSVEKVLLQTLPGFYLGGNLYRPVGKPGRHPGIASPHGHWQYGRLENSSTVSVPGRCINFARQGYVVFSYDMVGYDDTIQVPHEWGGPHGFGDLRQELWSFNTMGLQLWDSMRAIDFLQSLPDVDPERIGVTGASGGGTQTFLVSAVDPRVKVAAPVNMISAIMQGGDCESAEGLRVGTFNVEIGALMAPRPLLMVSATGDWTRNTPHDEFPAVQSIYRLYDKPELVESVQVDAPHNYNKQSREAVYRFFGRHLLGDTDSSKFAEQRFRVEKLQDVLALHDRKLPENAVDRTQLFEQWVAAAQRQAASSAPEDLRERLSLALAADWPSRVLSEADGERIVLSRPGKGDRVPGIWIRGKGPATLIVDPKGSEAARQSPAARDSIRAGRPVLMIDAFQTGNAVAHRDPMNEPPSESYTREAVAQEFLVYNKGDAANRVQDVLTALAFLSQSGASSITLEGLGEADVWCIFAAAVAKTPVTIKATSKTDFHGEDNEFIDRFFVPGIQRAGGLKAATLLATSSKDTRRKPSVPPSAQVASAPIIEH